MMMPTISTSCWYLRGTEKRAMMMMKTNRLSMLRLYSVTQPATNWPPYSGPVNSEHGAGEHQGQCHVEGDPEAGFFHGGLVRALEDQQQVDERG